MTHLIEFIVHHRQTERDEREGNDEGQGQQPVHRLLIGPVDGNTRRRAHLVLQSLGQLAENLIGLGLGLVGQVLEQLSRNETGPHRTRNSCTHGTTHLHRGEKHGRRGSNFLVTGRGLNTELHRHIEQPTAAADHDLRAQNLEVRGTFTPAQEHQCQSSHVDGASDGDEDSVALGIFDEN